MPVDNRTPNLNLPLPDAANKMASEDVPRLRELVNALDTLLDDRPTASAVATLISDAINAAVASLVPTSRNVQSGTGLVGGGDLTQNRTIQLSAASQASLAAADAAAPATRQIFAGTGLTGGGNLTQNRTISLSTESQSSLAKADAAAPDTRKISTGTGLTGGGNLRDDRTISLNTASQNSLAKAEAAAPATRQIFAGAGLTGGGALTQDRTLALELVNGKIPVSLIPSQVLSEYLGVVGSQSAMLALSGEAGDWCHRDDTDTRWTLITTGGSQLAHWLEQAYPDSPVSSVNGQTGAVSLGAGDVGADPAGTAAGLTTGLASENWVNDQISDLASESWVNDQIDGLATSGSGGNGRYVRLPGGVLLMWHRLTSHGSNAQTWNYPVASETDPRVMITPEAVSPRSAVVNTPGNTSANFRVYDQNNNQIAEQVQIMAIGTWV